MAISGWLKGLAVVTVSSALLCNLPTRLWLPAERATVQYLADTFLQTVDESQGQLKVIQSNNNDDDDDDVDNNNNNNNNNGASLYLHVRVTVRVQGQGQYGQGWSIYLICAVTTP